MEAGAGDRSRNIMRIRNLTRTGIILALGTERLYLEPTRKPAIVRWAQNTIGTRHIEFGASYQCLQVPIREDIAHVEGIPDPEPGTLFLVDHHVFSNCDRPDVFTYNDEVGDGNGKRYHRVFGWEVNGLAAKGRETELSPFLFLI